MSREQNDRRLFEDIAASYAAKDTNASARVARSQRAKRTMAVVGFADHLLEVGCGAGYAPLYLDGSYRQYTGIDYSENLISHARQVNGAPNRKFIAGNARIYEFGEQFDVVLMIGVLHHMDKPLDTLRKLVDCLAPGGALVVNEPQSANPLIRMARTIRKKINKEYSDEQDQYTESELRELLQLAGLSKIEFTAQGVFSTPFAEVAMPLSSVSRPIAALACRIDIILELRMQALLKYVSWNLVATGVKGSGSS